MAISHICFFGASTTEGLGDEAGLGWVGRLMDLTFEQPETGPMIRPAGYNLGVRGQTTSMMLARFDAECRARLPDHAGPLIFFSLGLNDIARLDGGPMRLPRHRTLENVEKMLSQAQGLGKVLWGGPAPVAESRMPVIYATGQKFHFDNETVLEINETYRDLAVERGIPYLDIFTPLSADADFTASLEARDGLHPNGAGYQRIAELASAWPAWRELF